MNVVPSCIGAFVSLHLWSQCSTVRIEFYQLFFFSTFDVVFCIQLQSRQLPLKRTFGWFNLITANHLNHF